MLVEPQHPGNVGAVARLLANFAAGPLVLVGGCAIDGEAQARAKAGRPLLAAAARAATLAEAVAPAQVAVATSGIVPEGDKRWFRTPVPLRELPALLDGREPALVFGRENYGLYREELAQCDVTVQVPTNPDHPILNLSHAVGTVLYELHRDDAFAPPHRPEAVTHGEIDRLVARVMALLEDTKYPVRRRARAETTLRRVLSRGRPDAWDYETLMGALKALRWRLDGTFDDDDASDDGEAME